MIVAYLIVAVFISAPQEEDNWLPAGDHVLLAAGKPLSTVKYFSCLNILSFGYELTRAILIRLTAMYKRQILWLLLLSLLIEQPAWAGCCGRVCGQAINHGKLTQRSNRDLLRAQRVAILRTQAIDQYTKLGCQLEAKKRWADAERTFRYVLQVVSLRDGPGSFKSVPALEHLATVSKAQNKLDQAISFQETALLLTKSQKAPNQKAVLNGQLTLGDLYLQKQDYRSAEEVLRDSVAMYKSQPSLPSQKRHITYQHYAKVLRQLHKDSAADAIELATADANNSKPVIEKSAESKQISPPHNADSPSLPAQTAPVLKQETRGEQH